MMQIKMVDLKPQYLKIKTEVDAAIQEVIDNTEFINGTAVKRFQADLATYHGDGVEVIPCANGTDALQIAMMALGLKHGDEVIVPTFTYVATAEVIALLGLTPVMVDVDPGNFNITAEAITAAITPKTKAIVPVHLFGQCADMESILDIAEKHNLFVIEDNAQAIGADYTFKNGKKMKSGTMGHIGTTSFFPSKNLGCYGDGGAITTKDPILAEKIRIIANHGQSKLYTHSVIGVNSRLDSIQAAILDVKLQHLDAYAAARNAVATAYDTAFSKVKALKTPERTDNSTHVFHQYTLRVLDGRRDALRAFLAEKGVPAMIYYPIPLYKQDAFKAFWQDGAVLPVTEQLCTEVISLPIHTEMTPEIQDYIINQVLAFFE